MSETTITLLKHSWSDCEAVIDSIGLKRLEEMQTKLGRKKFSEIMSFLVSMGFVANDDFTPLGSEFYTNKFILNDCEASKTTLMNATKQYLPTQAICQLLWGRPNLTKESIYRLLVHSDYINPKEYALNDLGGFLMLLNTSDIISYNKKGNTIAVLYNPRTNEEFKSINAKFLSPETPYSNMRNLRELLRESNEFVHWFDKHFSMKGLEPLHDEADGNKIKEIKILTGIISGKINERLRDDFIRFRGRNEHPSNKC